MRKSDCIEGRSIGAECREAARGPLISKACKRAERLEVADARKPGAHVTAVAAAPVLDGKHAEWRPENEPVEQFHEPVVAGLEPFEIALELRDGARGRKAVAADCGSESGEPPGLEGLRFVNGEYPVQRPEEGRHLEDI